MRSQRRLPELLLLAAISLAAGCSNSSAPVSPTNAEPTPFDVSRCTAAPVVAIPSTYVIILTEGTVDASGTYTQTPGMGSYQVQNLLTPGTPPPTFPPGSPAPTPASTPTPVTVTVYTGTYVIPAFTGLLTPFGDSSPPKAATRRTSLTAASLPKSSLR